MDNVIEALGKGKKKNKCKLSGRGWTEVKDFIKKHQGKLSAVAGALGTIATIAALSSMNKPNKKESLEVAVSTPPTRSRRLPSSDLDEEELAVAREIGLLPPLRRTAPQAIPLKPEHRQFLREREEQKTPAKEDRARALSSSSLVPLPRTPPLSSRQLVPQAIPISAPKPKGPPPSLPLPKGLYVPKPPPKKSGNGKKRKKNNSLLKQVMNYKIKHNVSLKEAWAAIKNM